MKHKHLIGATACCITLVTTTAFAEDNEQLLGRFKQWSAMHYEEGGQRVCVMWSAPDSASPSDREQDAHAFVSHRSKERVYNEISVQIGVPLKAGSVLAAQIGSQRFTLYTDGDSAWNNSLKEDQRMVRAMRAGRTLEVRATTANGNKVTDRYSLFGFTSAHKSISEACGAR